MIKESNKTQLRWLIGPLSRLVFPLPAGVNQAPCGGGVPEDRTHTQHPQSRGVRSGSLSAHQPSGFVPEDRLVHRPIPQGALLHSLETQLPLLKNFPTIATLQHNTFCAIRTQSTSRSFQNMRPFVSKCMTPLSNFRRRHSPTSPFVTTRSKRLVATSRRGSGDSF